MLQPDPNKLTVKTVLQSKLLDYHDLKEYVKLREMNDLEAESLRLPIQEENDEDQNEFWVEFEKKMDESGQD